MKTNITSLVLSLFAIFSLALAGCGGGDDNNTTNTTTSDTTTTTNTSTSSPDLTILPSGATYDFGIITDGNSVAPLVVTLRNDGDSPLDVSSIVLSDSDNFQLDLNGGDSPCGSSSPTIASGALCTATVDFLPQTNGTFAADLTIQSNDADSPGVLGMTGTKEYITAISLKINQIEACPRANTTVYVSVTDQGGYPVTTLAKDDFSLTEDGSAKSILNMVSVDETVTLSVSLLMDYSYSITQEPDNVTDMENAVISLINQLGDDDEAEIIKFAEDVEVTQSFTSDKPALIEAVQSTPDIGTHTALYDSAVRAAQDISASAKDRRAIILITDGTDAGPGGVQWSVNDLDDVIVDANLAGVPVFTVGIGNADVTILQQIADETGGTYSESTTSDNLATVYQQLSDLLFTDQYILTYNSDVLDSETGELTVSATYATGISDSDTKTIAACP